MTVALVVVMFCVMGWAVLGKTMTAGRLDAAGLHRE
jgi:hypothetical protein